MNFAFDLETQTEAGTKPRNHDFSDPVDKDFKMKVPQLTQEEIALHEKALEKSLNFKRTYGELLEIIMKIDKSRLFEKFLLTSTFSYCTQVLKLSEDITCTLTKIARVSQKVPELKAAIDEGLISISNAKRIAPIVTAENKREWIEKARVLPQRNLEKEVAKTFPKEAVQEIVKFVSEERIKLEIGLGEETLKLLRLAQDLISQKSRYAATLEATLSVVIKEFVEKHDPVEQAKRVTKRDQAKVKHDLNENEQDKIKLKQNCKLSVSRRGAGSHVAIHKRIAIPAEILHQVNLRDKRQCQAQLPNGTICGSKRWLDYHHKIPVKMGGLNAIENLTTLCSQLHRLFHA